MKVEINGGLRIQLYLLLKNNIILFMKHSTQWVWYMCCV